MTSKWQRKLTAKQRKHLVDSNATTLAAFRRTREAQAGHGLSDGYSACHECDAIARRLGMPG
jgi:hypothetical protein